MDYIVLDMEWNQPWPGSPSSKKVLPVTIRGEIIQIGAVRLTEGGQVLLDTDRLLFVGGDKHRPAVQPQVQSVDPQCFMNMPKTGHSTGGATGPDILL